MRLLAWIKSFMPQTLMGRSLLILILPVILTQIIATIVFLDNHWDKMTNRLAYGLAGEIAIIADQMETNYTPEQFKKISAYMAQNLSLLIAFDREAKLQPRKQDYGIGDFLVISPLLEALDDQVRRPSHVTVDLEEKWIEVKIQLSNGVLTVLSPERRLFSSSGYIFILWLMGSSLVLLMISILFMRNQIRPIRKLAIAAERMGKGRDLPQIKTGGAREVRQAAYAFETMQRRIRRQIEQRTAMLAGVSHDLRTPLTRLKLEVSMLEDGDISATMMRDLTDMEKMINAYLDFARGEKIESTEIVAIKDYLEEFIQSYPDSKLHIAFNPQSTNPHLVIQPINFKRCLENIVNNASRYANNIQITVASQSERVIIVIEDDGPGIPEDKKEEVFRPFVRLDHSRNPETGGAGLGLSVAMDIILSHGGKISLHESENLGGLKVRLNLPR